MKPLFFLSFIFLANHSFTQEAFIVDAGKKVNDVIPVKAQYQYPEFLNGKVFFRDGNISEGKLNYNQLVGEMQFISKTGDTLALDNEPTIKFVCIDKDTFYYDNGFVMLIEDNNVIRLAAKHRFTIVDMKIKAAGYDMTSGVSSVSSMSSYNDGIIFRNLTVTGKVQLTQAIHYYFGNKYGHFVLANKKNLFNLFPGCTGKLKRFIRKNKIDFSKRNDLERVTNFLEGSCQTSN